MDGMDGMNLDYYVQQLPNFLGLIIAIIVQWQLIRTRDALIERLLDVIIKRENCDDPPEL